MCFKILEDSTQSDYTDLASELKVLIQAGEHTNIVNILGACTRGKNSVKFLRTSPREGRQGFKVTRKSGEKLLE